MAHLTGLLWAAFSGLACRSSPGLFLVLFLFATVTVLHGGWVVFGALTALSGALVSPWLLTPRGRTEWVRRLLSSPVSISVCLLVGGAWMSLLVNRGALSGDELSAVLRDTKGITLALVVYAAGFGFATSFSRVRLAIWGLLGTSGVLGLLRVSQMVGVDLTAILNTHLGMNVLGDLPPFAMQNSYASFLVMVLALGLFVGMRQWGHWTRVAACLVLLIVFQWLLVGTQSRTGVVSYGIVLATALVFARGRGQKLAIGGAAVAFGLQVLLNIQIGGPKSVLPAVPKVETKVVLADLPPDVEGRLTTSSVKELSFWGSNLSSSRFAIVQRIRMSEGLLRKDNVINLFIRPAPWDTVQSLDLSLDGHLVYRLMRTSDDFHVEGFSWVQASIPRDLLVGKRWVTVHLQIRGTADQRVNYVQVMGGNFLVDGVQSEFFTGYSHLTEDLSEAPGRQVGTFMIFLNEYWPLAPMRIIPVPRWALDNSLMARLAWARVAISNYLAHPIVGSGFGSLVWLAPKYLEHEPVFGEFANVHSNFLQILSECGILGEVGWVGMVLFPIILILVRLYRRRSTSLLRWFNVSFLAYFLAWALQSLSQYTVTDTRLFHLWLFYLGLWAAQFHRGGYGLVLPQFALNRRRWRRVSLANDGGRVNR